jgi:hypothetical protein
MEKYDTGVSAVLYLNDDGLTAKKEAVEEWPAPRKLIHVL